MKKIVSVVVTTALIITSTSISFATGDYFEFSKKPSVNYDKENERPATSQEIENVFNKIQNNFNEELDEISETERMQNLEEVLQVYSAQDLNSTSLSSDQSIALNSVATASYDQNKALLRGGNFIETILNYDEGLSNTDITRIANHSSTAKSLAAKAYPNDVMKQDALRHFSWNFLSAKNTYVGALKTRTATINHEWGLIILNPALREYDSKYTSYRKLGYSESNAASKALADTIMFIPSFKKQVVTVSKSSYSFFKGIFTVGNIMDLHNNCYGRAYASSDPGLTAEQAFNKANRSNKLILSEASVTGSHYYGVWASGWYTY